jgi:hypothetical protein
MSNASNGTGREHNGQFAKGSPGGPGRPRRAVEREYLATISDACPPDVWRKIVDTAVACAKGGDAKARDWLTRYLLGDKPPTLLELAAAEHNGDGPEAMIERKAKCLTSDAMLDTLRNVFAQSESAGH